VLVCLARTGISFGLAPADFPYEGDAMATTKKPDTLRAGESFACEVDGEPVLVHAGEVVHDACVVN
jgi:hypothetical protein